MRRSQKLQKENLEAALEIIEARLVESIMNGNFENAKKEMELFSGLLKIANLAPKNKPISIAAERQERDRLIDELNKKLEKINNSKNYKKTI